MQNSFILATGDSDGLGNAVVRSVLRQCSRVRVIGFSRRRTEEVKGYSELTPEERERYHRLRTDFRDLSGVERAARHALDLVRNAGGLIRALVLVNGTGFLDSQIAADPTLGDTMTALNIAAPVELAHQVWLNQKDLSPHFRIFYFSGLVTHPSVSDPLLSLHATTKKTAERLLRKLAGQRLTVVLPGAYKTPMLHEAIQQTEALLEWFSVPLADPYAKGGLADLLAKLCTDNTARPPSVVIRPRLSRWLVTHRSRDGLRSALPQAIRKFARTVLHQVGQTDDDHNARVAFFKKRQLYGDTFPYDSITSRNLWPHSISLAASRLLNALMVLR